MKHAAYELHRLTWQDIEIEVRYCPDWLPGSAQYAIAHIEVRSECRSPLPITETGYKSHFTNPDVIAEHGGPVSFVEAWLDADAKDKGWKDSDERSRQYSLF